MKCIIIDDEKIARVILKTLCNEIRSLNVLEDFPDAIQAIKYLNKNQVDLIFLDIHMPIMGGYEAARQIQTIYPDLPLVAISAAVSPFSLDEAKDAGLRAFIGKPYQSNEILDLIKELA